MAVMSGVRIAVCLVSTAGAWWCLVTKLRLESRSVAGERRRTRDAVGRHLDRVFFRIGIEGDADVSTARFDNINIR